MFCIDTYCLISLISSCLISCTKTNKELSFVQKGEELFIDGFYRPESERMHRCVQVFILFLVSSFVSNHVFDNGRQKYEQLLALSSSNTSPCWQRVLAMLHAHCSIDELERYQSFIAYQFTLCHLSAMNNDLSQLPCTEDNTHVCVEQLHEHMNAFIGN